MLTRRKSAAIELESALAEVARLTVADTMLQATLIERDSAFAALHRESVALKASRLEREALECTLKNVMAECERLRVGTHFSDALVDNFVSQEERVGLDQAVADNGALRTEITRMQEAADAQQQLLGSIGATNDAIVAEIKTNFAKLNAALSQCTQERDAAATECHQMKERVAALDEDNTARKCQLYDSSNDVARWGLDAFRHDLNSMQPDEFASAVALAAQLLDFFAAGSSYTRVNNAVKPGIDSLVELAGMEARKLDSDSLSVLQTLLEAIASRPNQEMWGMIRSLFLGALRVAVTAMVHYPRINKSF